MLKNLNPAVALASLVLAGAAVWTTQTSSGVVLTTSKLNGCDIDIDPPDEYKDEYVRIGWTLPTMGATVLKIGFDVSNDDLLVVRDHKLNNWADLDDGDNTIYLTPTPEGAPTAFTWKVERPSSGTKPASGTWPLPAIGKYDPSGISEITLERSQIVGSTRRMRMWITHQGLATMLYLQDE